MNIAKYSAFRVFIISFLLGGCLSFGGFVAMEDQVIAFYEQESSYDTLQDSSFQKYLGNGQTLLDSTYVPQDLVAIESDFVANGTKSFLLRKEAAQQFSDLAWHFWDAFKGDRLVITSTYRSATFQASLLKKGCNRAKCAEVGSSEHQLGLAIDLGVMTKNGKYIALTKGNKYYQRLASSGAEWGFHNSYQKGIAIDGQMEEGRHWRYLGSELALSLWNQQQSFSERYVAQQQPLKVSFN